jgi:hypothetical protein
MSGSYVTNSIVEKSVFTDCKRTTSEKLNMQVIFQSTHCRSLHVVECTGDKHSEVNDYITIATDTVSPPIRSDHRSTIITITHVMGLLMLDGEAPACSLITGYRCYTLWSRSNALDSHDRGLWFDTWYLPHEILLPCLIFSGYVATSNSS